MIKRWFTEQSELKILEYLQKNHSTINFQPSGYVSVSLYEFEGQVIKFHITHSGRDFLQVAEGAKQKFELERKLKAAA